MNGICELCGKYLPLEKHHVFNGPFRKKSDKLKLIANLCHWCHNEPPEGVHFNQERDNALKAKFQARVMAEQHWTKEDFIREFGKSYI